MILREKYIMWVDEIDNEDEIVYAVGHKKVSESEDSIIKFTTEFDFEWLRIMLAEQYDEFMQLGRMFYYIHIIEPGCEINRIELTNFEGLTEEEIESAKKRAEDWANHLKEE